MKAIIAKNALGFIGLNGGLPFYCKDDLRHFAKLTAGCTLLAGYNTSLQLPQLKDRVVIVAPRRSIFRHCEIIDWCIGGAATYEKYAHLFTELHISTKVDDLTEGDVLMPKLENLNPKCEIFNYQFTKKA